MKVRSGLADNRVALWERHPAHPGGEVFIAGERAVDVAGTAAVQRALKDGRLVEVAPSQSVAGTVEEILAAVERGEIAPADALAAEQAGKGRVTLLAALQAILDDAALEAPEE
jgi:hypothetical protein